MELYSVMRCYGYMAVQHKYWLYQNSFILCQTSKALEIPKIKDLFELSSLKFLYNFKKGLLLKFIMPFRCNPRSSIHDHDTRYASQINTISTQRVMAINRIRCRLPGIINYTTKALRRIALTAFHNSLSAPSLL